MSFSNKSLQHYSLEQSRESTAVSNKTSKRVFLLVHDAYNGVCNASELNALIEADWRVLGFRFEPRGGYLVTLEGEVEVHDGEFADGVEQSTE